MSQVESNNEDVAPSRNESRYEDRKTDFTQHFVNALSLMGYIVIVIQFVKFESSFWILLARASFHSLLTNPFPGHAQLRRIAQRTGRTTSSTPDVDMPGGFTNAANLSNMPHATRDNSNITTAPPSTEDEIMAVKKKIRKLIFHGSFTLNLIVLIWNILHPTHFLEKLGGMYPHEKYLKNIPSPFVSGDGLLGGEFRGTAFIQFIGESIPHSNTWGNINKSAYDFLILILEYTLFILTCINFGEMGYVPPADNHSQTDDGYTGDIITVEVDFNKSLDIMVNDINDGSTR
ncbi:similar to Saccharomyces cerevisiae YPR109W Predicted membrane protein [Maudiozyma barnettii]|uniref:Similar to Saccharomyces cerevisiae YPR109W Predicted membrane protein n=1 Tax=Maudiozyma barnettii TaxID=61262 RepID=A0A8H2ZFS7_9SACH|nr:Gld1p [Kazachstania barnettii]CAB4252080.1 similar to Saccharomyces cerevisiae YPR109W Predicted membrane protein [Kazachstania barnettii]CAD1778577.1 similar to Saccharomyces cerevisiae YPR109W Predicted membrane protein [Kazachstania barnettii]